MTSLPVAAAALILLGGLFLLLAYRPPAPHKPSRNPLPARAAAVLLGTGKTRRARQIHYTKLALTVPLSLLLWWLIGWAGALIAVPAAVFGLPILLSPPPGGTDLDKLTALEGWTRSLASMIRSGQSLRQTLTASLASCPAPIRGEVTDLVRRLGAGADTERALDLFGDAIGDATGDKITAVLKLAATAQGPGLASRLEALADTVAREVSDRRDIESDRAKPRTSARIVTIVMISITTYFLITGGARTDAYRQPLGQLVLTILLSLFVLLLLLIRRMTTARPQPRFMPPSSRRT